MSNYATQWMADYRRTGLLLDTNLLLLYCVGLLERDRIPLFKRTKKFAVEDYDTLVNILGLFEKIIVTPHILAEVSNLGGQLPTPLNEGFFAILRIISSELIEQYVVSAVAMQGYAKLGLTDAGIIYLLADKQYFVLSDDFPLVNYLQTQGVDAVNFEHIRTLNWK